MQQCTLSVETYFDKAATVEELSQYGYAAHFLDFEISNSVVPMWAVASPYKQLPFQFNVHPLQADRSLT